MATYTDIDSTAANAAAFLLSGGAVGQGVNVSSTNWLATFPKRVFASADAEATYANLFPYVPTDVLVKFNNNPSNPDLPVEVCGQPLAGSFLTAYTPADFINSYSLSGPQPVASLNPALTERTVCFVPRELTGGYSSSFPVSSKADRGVYTTSRIDVFATEIQAGVSDLSGQIVAVTSQTLPKTSQISKAGLESFAASSAASYLVAPINAAVSGILLGGTEIEYFSGFNTTEVNPNFTLFDKLKGVEARGPRGIFQTCYSVSNAGTPDITQADFVASTGSGACIVYCERDLQTFYQGSLEVVLEYIGQFLVPPGAQPGAAELVANVDYGYIDTQGVLRVVTRYFSVNYPFPGPNTAATPVRFSLSFLTVPPEINCPTYFLGIRSYLNLLFPLIPTVTVDGHLNVQVKFQQFDPTDNGRSSLVLFTGGYARGISVTRKSCLELVPNAENYSSFSDNLSPPAPPKVRQKVYKLLSTLASGNMGFIGLSEELDAFVSAMGTPQVQSSLGRLISSKQLPSSVQDHPMAQGLTTSVGRCASFRGILDFLGNLLGSVSTGIGSGAREWDERVNPRGDHMRVITGRTSRYGTTTRYGRCSTLEGTTTSERGKPFAITRTPRPMVIPPRHGYCTLTREERGIVCDHNAGRKHLDEHPAEVTDSIKRKMGWTKTMDQTGTTTTFDERAAMYLKTKPPGVSIEDWYNAICDIAGLVIASDGAVNATTLEPLQRTAYRVFSLMAKKEDPNMPITEFAQYEIANLEERPYFVKEEGEGEDDEEAALEALMGASFTPPAAAVMPVAPRPPRGVTKMKGLEASASVETLYNDILELNNQLEGNELSEAALNWNLLIPTGGSFGYQSDMAQLATFHPGILSMCRFPIVYNGGIVEGIWAASIALLHTYGRSFNEYTFKIDPTGKDKATVTHTYFVDEVVKFAPGDAPAVNSTLGFAASLMPPGTYYVHFPESRPKNNFTGTSCLLAMLLALIGAPIGPLVTGYVNHDGTIGMVGDLDLKEQAAKDAKMVLAMPAVKPDFHHLLGGTPVVGLYTFSDYIAYLNFGFKKDYKTATSTPWGGEYHGMVRKTLDVAHRFDIIMSDPENVNEGNVAGVYAMKEKLLASIEAMRGNAGKRDAAKAEKYAIPKDAQLTTEEERMWSVPSITQAQVKEKQTLEKKRADIIQAIGKGEFVPEHPVNTTQPGWANQLVGETYTFKLANIKLDTDNPKAVESFNAMPYSAFVGGRPTKEMKQQLLDEGKPVYYVAVSKVLIPSGTVLSPEAIARKKAEAKKKKSSDKKVDSKEAEKRAKAMEALTRLQARRNKAPSAGTTTTWCESIGTCTSYEPMPPPMSACDSADSDESSLSGFETVDVPDAELTEAGVWIPTTHFAPVFVWTDAGGNQADEEVAAKMYTYTAFTSEDGGHTYHPIFTGLSAKWLCINIQGETENMYRLTMYGSTPPEYTLVGIRLEHQVCRIVHTMPRGSSQRVYDPYFGHMVIHKASMGLIHAVLDGKTVPYRLERDVEPCTGIALSGCYVTPNPDSCVQWEETAALLGRLNMRWDGTPEGAVQCLDIFAKHAKGGAGSDGFDGIKESLQVIYALLGRGRLFGGPVYEHGTEKRYLSIVLGLVFPDKRMSLNFKSPYHPFLADLTSKRTFCKYMASVYERKGVEEGDHDTTQHVVTMLQEWGYTIEYECGDPVRCILQNPAGPQMYLCSLCQPLCDHQRQNDPLGQSRPWRRPCHPVGQVCPKHPLPDTTPWWRCATHRQSLKERWGSVPTSPDEAYLSPTDLTKLGKVYLLAGEIVSNHMVDIGSGGYCGWDPTFSHSVVSEPPGGWG